MHCPQCGTPVDPQANNCPNCGAPLPHANQNQPEQAGFQNQQPAQPAYQAVGQPAQPAYTQSYPQQGQSQPSYSQQQYSPYGQTAVQAAPKKKMSRGLKLGLIIGGGVLVLLLVLGGIYHYLSTSVYSPKNAANEYITALSKGEFSKATSLVKPSGGDTSLLTDSVGKGMKYRISDPQVISTTKMGDHWNVVVSFRLNSRTVRATLQEKENGRQAGLFAKYEVTTSLAKNLTITTPGMLSKSALKINGVEVKPSGSSTDATAAGDATGQRSYLAYPGSYSVDASSSKFYTTNSPSTSVYGSDYQSNYAMELRINPTSAFASALQDAMKTKLNEFAKNAGPQVADRVKRELGSRANGFGISVEVKIVSIPDVPSTSNTYTCRYNTYSSCLCMGDGTVTLKGINMQDVITITSPKGEKKTQTQDIPNAYVRGNFTIDGDTINLTLNPSDTSVN